MIIRKSHLSPVSLSSMLVLLLNYLKVTFRNLKRNIGYTLVNIFGLAVGIACCILIMLFVFNEFSYDGFHQKKDRTYRLVGDYQLGSGTSQLAVNPAPLSPTMAAEFPEIEYSVRLLRPFGGVPTISYEDQAFAENLFTFADTDFFNVFSYPLLSGDPQTALASPNQVILTKETANKYFGDENPVGKTLLYNKTTPLEVTGVLDEIPGNTQIQFDFIASMETFKGVFPAIFDIWGSALFHTYVVFSENHNPALTEEKLPPLLDKYISRDNFNVTYHFEPIQDVYLYSDYNGNLGILGDIQMVYIFSTIAMLILGIACINFMNLSTARSSRRAKEIGMRKALGSTRSGLVNQFLLESVIMSFIALTLGILVIQLTIPSFNLLVGKSISFNVFTSWKLMSLMTGLAIGVGILAGSYPALYLSKFRPSIVLKGTISTGKSAARLRKTLVITQFTISITLMVVTGLVYNQLDFIKSKDLGLNKEQVLVVPLGGASVGQQIETLKQKLAQNPNIEQVAASLNVPGSIAFGFDYHLDGKAEDDVSNISSYIVDADFVETMGIEIISGRSFSDEISSDIATGFLINETAAKQFGWDDPIGKKIDYLRPTGDGFETVKAGEVIGVLKDFHFTSLKATISPVIFQAWNDNSIMNSISMRVNTSGFSETSDYIQDTFKEVVPDVIYNASFLDEIFQNSYQSDEKAGTILIYFSIIAIVIACLGLFSLASFIAEQRTKEIGVRKVLGASTQSLIALLSNDFLKLVTISFVLASPIAYFSMRSWLQEFAYKADISIAVFLIAGLLGLLITLITVSYQAIKAATVNPVKSLRSE